MLHNQFALAACVALSFSATARALPAAPQLTLESRALPRVPGQGSEGAALPNLTRTPDGRVLLSFVRREGKQSVLLLSELEGTRWSAPREVARGEDWFVNWADFPSVTAARDGGLLAHWLQVSGAAKYAYDVRTSISRDNGETWSAAAVLHSDRQPTEHGFVSVAPDGPDGWRALWLDGRQLADGGPMALVSRRVAADGALGPEVIVDERVCDCCGTSLVPVAGGGFAAAWRDRTDAEVRDMSVARARRTAAGDVSFEPLTVVGDDGWVTQTCPVNGPRLAAAGDYLAISWFTAGGNHPRVNMAWSRGDKDAPSLSLRVDGSTPGTALGRGDLAWATGDTLCIGWLAADEGSEPGEVDATWWLRGYRYEGRHLQGGETLALARVSSARGSGFLRMASGPDGSVVAAWTARAAGEPARDEVHTALVTPTWKGAR